MDIQTFSETYWYIWFLLVFLIVILAILNGIGILLYRKRRQKFLNRPNETNENIPMREVSRVSTININKSKYQQMSVPSTMTSDSSYTNTTRSSYITSTEQRMISMPNITRISETHETTQSESESSSTDQTKEKNDIDLTIEEFQRQALKEHNSVRAMYNKPLLKLSESLNIYAQYWAEQCVRTNTVRPSRLEWRLQCKGQPIGENIVSAKSTNAFDGYYFTSLIMANGTQSYEVNCILNEISTEVGFGRARNHSNDDIQQQWIGVAHYYPYHQLTTVQS